jgi:hypothetical protein
MAMFRILPVGDGTSYKVEVSCPGGGVRIVVGFRSEAEAAAWIAHAEAEHRQPDTGE